MRSEVDQPTRRHERLLRTTAAAPFAFVVVAINLWIWMLFAHTLGIDIRTHFYDQQRIIQLCLLLSIVVAVAASDNVRAAVLTGWDRLPPGSRWGVLSFFALGCASATQAAMVRPAVREVGLFAVLAVVCLIIAGVRQQQTGSFDRLALRLLVAAASVYALVFATMDLAVDRGSTMIGFGNPRFFGQVGLWLFPLLMTAALRGTGRPAVRLGRWLTVIAWWALIVESGGRSAIIGSLLGIAVAPCALGRAGRAWQRSAVWVVVAGTSLWFAWVSVVGVGTGGLLRAIEKGSDASGRFDMWADTLRLVADRPLLGVGPEHYAYHDTYLGSPHNVPLQIAVEWGLPAALILAALVVWGAVVWLVKQRRLAVTGAGEDPEMYLPVGLTAPVVAAGFASLLEGMLSSALSQMLLVGMVGWILGVHLADRSTKTRNRQLPSHSALVAGSLAAFGALAVGALPHALNPDQEAATYLNEHPDERLAPRFWVQGRLIE